MRDFAGYVRQHLPRRDVPEDRFDEIVEELAAELESRYTTLVERGAREDEAWSAALAQIPSWSSFAHDLSQATGAPPSREQRPSRVLRPLALDRWLHDLKLAVRVLRKDRGFALTAITTLTICLGGHAAILAGVNGLLFHPLPVPEPERVLLMANQYPAFEQRRVHDEQHARLRGSAAPRHGPGRTGALQLFGRDVGDRWSADACARHRGNTVAPSPASRASGPRPSVRRRGRDPRERSEHHPERSAVPPAVRRRYVGCGAYAAGIGA